MQTSQCRLDRLPVPYRPGASWPAAFRPPARKALARTKRDSRLVILTGSRDFNLPRSRAVHEALVKEGFRHAAFLEIPGADHYHELTTEWLQRALDHLDPDAVARPR